MDPITSPNDQVLSVDYFYDFIQILNYVEEQKCTRTVTGNISRKSIDELNLDIQYGLLERDLKQFGCVEIDYTNGERTWNRKLIRFCSTKLGLKLYRKGLQPF